METKLEKEVRFLKAYAFIATLVGAVLALTLSHCKAANRSSAKLMSSASTSWKKLANLIWLSPTRSASRYLDNKEWLSEFGEIVRSQKETWGAVETVRAFYRTGLEIEYNFAAPSWAAIPVDAGTGRVVNEGMKIVFDPTRKFDALKRAVRKT